MPALRIVQLARVATRGLVLALLGCGEPQAPPAPTPRDDDPELTHSWQMPAGESVLWGGDLGSKPSALADQLMQSSAGPSIAMRSANACAQQGSLGATLTVAVRLTIAEGGSVTTVEGDPAGPAGTCLAESVKAELGKLDPLPAGAALLLMRFHAAAPR